MNWRTNPLAICLTLLLGAFALPWQPAPASAQVVDPEAVVLALIDNPFNIWVEEDPDGLHFVVFDISAPSPFSEPVSVPIRLEPTTRPGDFSANVGGAPRLDVLPLPGQTSLVFEPGALAVKIDVVVFDDNLFEGIEWFDVVVGSDDDPAAQKRFPMAVLDNDVPEFAISNPQNDTDEGSNGVRTNLSTVGTVFAEHPVRVQMLTDPLGSLEVRNEFVAVDEFQLLEFANPDQTVDTPRVMRTPVRFLELIEDDVPDASFRKQFGVTYRLDERDIRPDGEGRLLGTTTVTLTDDDVYYTLVEPDGGDDGEIEIHTPSSDLDIDIAVAAVRPDWPFDDGEEFQLTLRSIGSTATLLRNAVTVAENQPIEPFRIRIPEGAPNVTVPLIFDMSNRSQDPTRSVLDIKVTDRAPEMELLLDEVTEGDAADGIVTLPIARLTQGIGPFTMSVQILPTPGAAEGAGPDDVRLVDTTARWTGTDPIAPIRIEVDDDALVEGPEQFDVVLGDPIRPALSRRFTVTIQDDELFEPIIEIADSVLENGVAISGRVTLAFTAGNDLEFRVRTRNGEAIAGTDYDSLDTVVIIPAGEEASDFFEITIRNDEEPGNPSAPRFFVEALTTGSPDPVATATVAIIEDEAYFVFSEAQPGELRRSIMTVREPQFADRTFDIPVRNLVGGWPFNDTDSVTLTLVEQAVVGKPAATEGVDWEFVESGGFSESEIELSPARRSGSFQLFIKDDPLDETEGPESIFFRIDRSNATPGFVGSLLEVIIDDTPTGVSLDPQDFTIVESDGPVEFTVTLDEPSVGVTRFRAQTSIGAFGSASDIVALDEIVEIADGLTTATFEVEIVDNDISDFAELRNFFVTLLDADGQDALALAQVFIGDDEGYTRLEFQTLPRYEQTIQVIEHNEDGLGGYTIPIAIRNPSPVLLDEIELIAIELDVPDEDINQYIQSPQPFSLLPGAEIVFPITATVDPGFEPTRFQIIGTNPLNQRDVVDFSLIVEVDDQSDTVLVPIFSDVGEIVDAANDGLAGGGEALDANGLPLVGDDVSGMFALDEALPAAELDGPGPSPDPILEGFADSDCVTDFAVNGAGDVPVAAAGDTVQVTCTVNAGVIPASDDFVGDVIAADTSGLLEGLADDLAGAFTIDGDFDWSAGVSFTFTAGADADGAYILGSSGFDLEITGNGDVSGSGRIAGIAATFDGTADGELTTGLRLDADAERRLRLADVLALVPDDLFPVTNGEAMLALDGTLPSTTFSWVGTWQVVENVTTVTASLDGSVDLPGLLDDTGAAASAAFTGAYDRPTSTWTVVGSLDDVTGVSVGIFDVSSLTIRGELAPTRFGVAADLRVAVGSFDADVAIAIAESGWSGGATLEVAGVRLGVIQLDRRPDDPSEANVVMLSVAIAHDSASGSTATTGTVTAPQGTFGVPGVSGVTATGVRATLLPGGEFIIAADSSETSITAGALVMQTGPITMTSPDAAGVVVRIPGEAILTSQFLGNLELAATGVTISEDGRVSADSVVVRTPADFVGPAIVVGMIPIRIAGLVVTFTNRDADGRVADLGAFQIDVIADIEPERIIGLPFTPVIGIGDTIVRPTTPPEQRRVTFSANVVSTAPLLIEPLDFGPLTLGVEGLELGGVTLDAQLTAGRFVAGQARPDVAGEVTVRGAFGGNDGSATVAFDASFVDDGDLIAGIAGRAELSFDLDNNGQGGGQVAIDDLAFTFDVSTGITADGVVLSADLISASAAALQIPIGPFMTARVTEVEIPDLTPEPGDPMITIGGDLSQAGTGASITFDDGLPTQVQSLSARAGNFSIDTEGDVIIDDGFFIDIRPGNVPIFPDGIPFGIDSIGVSFGDGTGIGGAGLLPGSKLSDVVDQVRLRVSGGLQGTPEFPVTAKAQGLEVEIARLIEFDPTVPFDSTTFPITNLDGIEFRLDPELDLGGLKITGGLTLGTIDIDGEDVLYGRITGGADAKVVSGNVDVVITDRGPVLLQIEAPVPVPLGPTGFMLKSVTGAAKFGNPRIALPEPGKPEQLLGNLFDLPTSTPINDATIRSAVRTAVANDASTWTDGFAIAFTATVTHVAAEGMFEGNLTLAAAFGARQPAVKDVEALAPGIQLIGSGVITTMGIPLAEGDLAQAGVLFDLSTDIEPRIDVAFQTPAPNSALQFLFPAKSTASAQLLTTGVFDGVVQGVEVFIGQLSSGALAALNTHLVNEPASPLARVLGPGPFDAASLQAALLEKVGSAGDAPVLVSALLTDLPNVLDPEQVAASIRTATRNALRAAESTFDPKFTINAQIQPTLFGFPLGDPTAEVAVSVDRDSAAFNVSGSLIETLKQSVDLPTGGFGPGLIGLATLGATDRFDFGVSVPLPEMSTILFPTGAGAEPLTPLDPDSDGRSWAIDIGGSISVAGLTAEMGGFITGPDNATFVDLNVQKRYELPADAPVVAGKAQIMTKEDYDNIITYGGVVVFGRMGIPRLITDPVGVLEDLPPLPPTLADVLPWFEEFGATIGGDESPLYASAFFPIPIDTSALPAAQRVSAESDWINSLWLTGVLDGTAREADGDRVARLLSIEIGTGTMRLSADGLAVAAVVPHLGLSGTFTVRAQTRGTAEAPVIVPAASLEIDLSAADASDALERLGLPNIVQVVDGEATFELRAYTPGFKPESEVDLERNGGIHVAGAVDLPFIDNARLELDLAPVGPDFDFSGSIGVDRIGPFAGLSLSGAVAVEKVGSDISITFDGSATLAVPGLDLDPDPRVTVLRLAEVSGFAGTSGGFRFEAQIGDEGLDLGGFELFGKIVADFTDSTPDVELDGRVSVPGLIDGARATARFDSGGLDEVTVEADRFGLTGVLEFVDNSATIRRIVGPVPTLIPRYEFAIGGDVLIPALGADANDPIAYSGFVTSTGEFGASLDVPNLEFLGATMTGSISIGRTQQTGFTATGTLRGKLTLLGLELARTDFTASFANGVFELRTNEPTRVDLGFVETEVSGVIRSDLTFDLQGKIASEFEVFNVGWDATLDVRFSTDTSPRITGSFDAEVFAGDFSGRMTASMSEGGLVKANIAVDLDGDGDTKGILLDFITFEVIAPERVDFEYQIGEELAPDTKRPVFRPLPDVEVTAFGSPAPVFFPPPVADDERSGLILGVCDPATGTIGTARLGTTTVRCSATDVAGNTATTSFTITQTLEQGIGSPPDVGTPFGPKVTVVTSPRKPNNVVVGLSGFQPGTKAGGIVFSTPQPLWSDDVDASGAVTASFDLPTDLPPGRHHLVLTGTAPSGSLRQVVLPIDVGAGGELLAVIGLDDQPTPSGDLPSTGSASGRQVTWAIGILLLGVGCALAGRRRRELPLGSADAAD